LCLEALLQLNYPKDKLEILIGDDQSNDATFEILSAYQKNHPKLIKAFHINHTIGNAKGKSNVLAQLAHHARGTYFFITDADIQVPSKWIYTLLSYFNDKIGIVSGSTMIKGDSIFERCQKIDWVYAFSMVDSVARLKIPVSGVGNNMAIKSKVYWETGGYENIKFSVVEDLDLFEKTITLGYQFVNVMDMDSLAFSTPQKSYKELLLQRHRWLKGVYRLSPILIGILFLHALFVPLFLISLALNLKSAFILLIFILIIKWSFIVMSFKRINQKYTWIEFFAFEIYTNLFPIILIFYSLFVKKVTWKGRTY
jgi:cellulose synthase/poly-beta-1,6-N-acetylglucosamine synthase-like glycosyltransferase